MERSPRENVKASGVWRNPEVYVAIVICPCKIQEDCAGRFEVAVADVASAKARNAKHSSQDLLWRAFRLRNEVPDF